MAFTLQRDISEILSKSNLFPIFPGSQATKKGTKMFPYIQLYGRESTWIVPFFTCFVFFFCCCSLKSPNDPCSTSKQSGQPKSGCECAYGRQSLPWWIYRSYRRARDPMKTLAVGIRRRNTLTKRVECTLLIHP